DTLVSSTANGVFKNENISRYVGFHCNIIKNDESGLEFTMNFEIIPSVDLKDLSGIEIKKYIAEITDNEIDDVLIAIMKYKKKWLEEPEDAVVELNHKVSITVRTKTKLKKQVESKPDDIDIVVGNEYINEELWKPLLGAKASETREFLISYPKNIEDKALAGKTAECSVTIKKIFRQAEYEMDDEFAKDIGYTDLVEAREWAKAEATETYENMSRSIAKVKLLEIISNMFDFAVPNSMLDFEYPRVLEQITQEAKKLDKKMTPAIDEECRKIARDRIRLGLVIAKIADENGIAVNEAEVSEAVRSLTTKYPMFKEKLLRLYANDKAALSTLIGTILEDKVVDFLMSKIKIEEEKCSVKELVALDEEEFDFFKDDLKDDEQQKIEPKLEEKEEKGDVDLVDNKHEHKPKKRATKKEKEKEAVVVEGDANA
ncbi:MAG: trigger factor, partial [Holosporaceae bacterium]|nr:trigger factor [Holosporaceae bacterium]